jgi:hypothetical protein
VKCGIAHVLLGLNIFYIMNYAALFAFIIRLVGLYFLYIATAQVIVLLSSAGLSAVPGARVNNAISWISLFGHLLASMWFFKGVPPYGGWASQGLTSKKDDT